LPLTRLDASRQESAHGGPAFLPDGRHFLYLRRSNRDQNSGIFVGSLGAKPEQQETRRLLATTFPVVYSSSPDASVGHILFLRENTLMAQPFDAAKLALAGDAVPVAESVTTSNGRGVFDVSGTGTLIYRTGAAGDQQRRLTWFDRQGKILGQLGDPADYVGGIALSPDAARVATTRGSGEGTDIWLLDSRGVSTRLTFDAAANGLPVWSPDEKYIAFRSNRGGKFDLYQKPSNGAGDDVLLVKSDEDKFPTDWSRDGRSLMLPRPVQRRTWICGFYRRVPQRAASRFRCFAPSPLKVMAAFLPTAAGSAEKSSSSKSRTRSRSRPEPVSWSPTGVQTNTKFSVASTWSPNRISASHRKHKSAAYK